jgi:2-polyprenyl-3-methyl-5-hydroxy-6-metoxy-1,4-benzoquinol methylase
MKTCTFCNSEARCVYENMKGYLAGDFFSVYECTSCKSQFVSPMENLEETYNLIYGKENENSLYGFYYYFARGIKKLKNPLKTLSNFTAIYWGVTQFLEKKDIKKGAKILEIGCGLGYFTHSLRKTGYDAWGLEYSGSATDYAQKEFGPYFFTGSLENFCMTHTEKYDCIIATEVIEHVTNPEAFVESALSLLAPQGKFILTTPNKDCEKEGTVWATDHAPIHLWWLTKKSFQKIAEKLGASVEILSFAEYKNKYLWSLPEQNPLGDPQKDFVLRKDGTRIETPKKPLHFSLPPLLYIHLVSFYHKLKFLQKQKNTHDDMYIICACFYKK